MPSPNNVDALLVSSPAAPTVSEVKDPIEVSHVEKPEKIKSEVQKEIDLERESQRVEGDKNPSLKKKEEENAENIQEDEGSSQKEENEIEDDGKDEYGNEVPKSKTYTEEDVQRMIRERLARVKEDRQANQQEQKQPVKNKSEDFQFDENSELGWQEQLEQFVEATVEKREKRAYERQRQEQEARGQEQEARETAEFESKFQQGMGRYPDFVETMRDKTVTDAMVMATRAMKDPAAFLYAAAKKYPGEIDRIAKLPNAFQQATEMGKLEERMKKAKQATKAAKLIESDKGDAVEKTQSRGRDIDRLIDNHAKSKPRR